jgi:hypothetical protein
MLFSNYLTISKPATSVSYLFEVQKDKIIYFTQKRLERKIRYWQKMNLKDKI